MSNKIFILNILFITIAQLGFGQQIRQGVYISKGTAKVDIMQPKTPNPTSALEISSNGSYNPTSEAFLQFNIGFLPENAQITSCKLRVHVKQTAVGTQGSRLFAVLPSATWNPNTVTWKTRPNTADTSLDARFITAIDTVVEYLIGDSKIVNAMVNNSNGVKTIGLKLSSNSWNSNVVFHSQTTAAASGIYSYSPRLIFEYFVEPEPRLNSGWETLQYNAQRTGQTLWSNNTAPTGLKVDTLYQPTGSIPGFPIIDNRTVYTFSETTSNKISLIKFNLQKEVLWNYPLQDQVMESILLDSYGNIFIVQQSKNPGVGDVIIMLSPDGKLKKKIPLKTRLAATPLLGFDNTLYLADLHEISALGNPPLYDTLWNHKNTSTVSSAATLNNKEQIVSLIRDDILVTLNQATGGLIASTKLAFPYSNLKEPIASTGSNLYTVTVGNNQAQISNINLNKISWKINGKSISGAAINKNSLYAVVDQTLQQIDLKSGKVLNKSVETDLAVNSSLLINNSGQLFFMAGDGNKNYIYGYSDDCKLLIKKDVTSFNINTNLIMGGDGTLYVSNSNILYQFFPSSYQGVPLTINQTILDKTNNTTLRGKSVTVDGLQITKDGNYFIQSGTNIGLQKGFKVAKGATVIFSTGYQ